MSEVAVADGTVGGIKLIGCGTLLGSVIDGGVVDEVAGGGRDVVDQVVQLLHPCCSCSSF